MPLRAKSQIHLTFKMLQSEISIFAQYLIKKLCWKTYKIIWPG